MTFPERSEATELAEINRDPQRFVSGKFDHLVVGEQPHTVRVYKRKQTGVLYAATWNARAKRYIRHSLGHTDRDSAVSEAYELAEKHRDGAERSLFSGVLTVCEMLERYVAEKRPTRKGKRQCYEDES